MSVMGDFSIKLGRGLLKGFELKGLVVEVMYRPAADLKAGRPILEVQACDTAHSLTVRDCST